MTAIGRRAISHFLLPLIWSGFLAILLLITNIQADDVIESPDDLEPAEEAYKTYVINGVEADECTFPYIGSIQRITGDYDEGFEISDPGNHFCAGTLIGPKHVLTAAHCFTNAAKGKWKKQQGVKMLFGLTDLTFPEGSYVDREVDKVFVHPRWDDEQFINDIAIIELNKPIKEDECLRYATLASIGDEASRQKKANLTGWGMTDPDIVAASRFLMTAENDIVSDKECNKKWREGGFENVADKSRICAGRYHFSCQGDSGGPLVVNIRGKHVLIGVVSYGPDPCATDNVPSVFTYVGYYHDWILNTINK